jgi:DNA-binding MarR family transcriptional regulator
VSDPAGIDRKLLAAVERLGRALRAGRQQAATRHGVSLLGVSVLEALDDRSAKCVGDLAAELDVSQPTVSDAVATLHKRGLIQRRRDPQDLRSNVASLTTRGIDVARSIAEDLVPILSANSGTADERGIALRVLLEEITQLQVAGVITVNRSCLTCSHYQPPTPASQAQCLLLGAPLTNQDLRVDCAEHEPGVSV